jgi:hypothetical protein
LPQLVEALGRHVRLLEAYVVKARTDSDYLGEVALKLRLLLLDSRKKKALLLRVGDAYRVDLSSDTVASRGVPGIPCGLLDLPVVDVNRVTLSLRSFVRAWREQLRNIPEDWTFDQVLLRSVDNLRVDGVCLAQSNLLQIASRVVAAARAMLRHIETIEHSGDSMESPECPRDRGAPGF